MYDYAQGNLYLEQHLEGRNTLIQDSNQRRKQVSSWERFSRQVVSLWAVHTIPTWPPQHADLRVVGLLTRQLRAPRASASCHLSHVGPGSAYCGVWVGAAWLLVP